MALKRHFARGSTYDFHKYNGKVNVKASSFETRGDKFWYEKIAKIRDPFGYMLANISMKPNLWVGDLLCEEANQNYQRWCSITESITYRVREEMSTLPWNFDGNFIFENGEHPAALKSMLDGSISPEVLSVVDQLVGFTKHWEKHSWDPTVKGSIHVIRKLKGFIEFDPVKIREVLVQIFSSRQKEKTAA